LLIRLDRLAVYACTSCAGGLKFKSQAGQIGHEGCKRFATASTSIHK